MSTAEAGAPASAALSGLKVVEFAQLIAGPMAGSFLADFGADVVHVEDPNGGDPLRKVGAVRDDIPLWWKVSGRNKRSATLNLRDLRGQDLARALVRWADVVVTNFRVDTLRSWGLDWDRLSGENPTLIMLQVSGFGSDTTLRNEPGFGKVGEAMSGVVHLTGFPDGPPLHAGFSHADALTGLVGAYGVQMALYRQAHDPDFAGELIDLALFEPLYRLIEWQVIIQDQLGVPPQRAGNDLPGAPGGVVNMFRAADAQWLTVSAGTARSARTLAQMFCVPVSDDPTTEESADLSRHLSGQLTEWIADRSADQALAALQAEGVVASKVYTAADIMEDQTYAERRDIIELDDSELGPVRMQAAVPRLRHHAGHVWRVGPALGSDNQLVYEEYLGLDRTELAELRQQGVI
jgi:crotonobetainyl-CoA:carnitine CoA-transferase CaiB-like acyl-CoA transferase